MPKNLDLNLSNITTIPAAHLANIETWAVLCNGVAIQLALVRSLWKETKSVSVFFIIFGKSMHQVPVVENGQLYPADNSLSGW